jgi:hypothetical protein
LAPAVCSCRMVARRIPSDELIIAYLPWDMLVDDDLDYARAAMADLAWDQGLRHQAALRRSEKLRAIGSQATFFSGLARINGDFRSV